MTTEQEAAHVNDCVCHRCQLRREADIVAHRLDIWTSADALLRGRQWPTEYSVDPRDVLTLACFLANELSTRLVNATPQDDD